MISSVKSLVKTFGGLYLVRQGLSYINEARTMASEYSQAETKLEEVMKAMQHASRSDVNGIKDLASEIAEYGVVSKGALINGAQQVSTYFHQTKAVETLLPAMADLSVQMHGVHTTAEDMVNIGNMFGKVMTGQVGALRRAGISFNETQEKVMKTGTEMEKASMLAVVVRQNVGDMNKTMANTDEGAAQKITNDFNALKTSIGRGLKPIFLDLFKSIHANMPSITKVIMTIGKAVAIVMKIVNAIVEVVGNFVAFCTNSLPKIEPIIMGIVGALVLYKTAQFLANVVTGASAALHGAVATAQGIQAVATAILTGDQLALNAAMYACPLVWIIGLILGLIVLIGLLIAKTVEAENSTRNATDSVNDYAKATSNASTKTKELGSNVEQTGYVAQTTMGKVLSVVTVVLAFIWNLIVGLWNGIAKIVQGITNLITNLASSLILIFYDPIAGIKDLFLSLGIFVVDVLAGIAELIDAVFGSNLADAVNGWSASMQSIVDEDKKKYGIEIDTVNSKDWSLNRWAYDDAYEWGAKKGDSFSSVFDEIKNNDEFNNPYEEYSSDDLGKSAKDTAKNTSDMADSLDVTNDQLKYIREYAEKEAINRFTTAEVNVHMTNNNNIGSNMDVDGITNLLATGIKKQLSAVREGV